MSYKNYLKLNQSALKNTAADRCILCGRTDTNITAEHVPPKATYSTKPQHQLLTVPACRKCNNGTSDIDQAFGFALGLYCEKESQSRTKGGKILFDKLSDTYNGTDKQKFPNELRPYYASYFDTAIVTDPWTTWWQRDFHDPVIQKIFTGLYWLNYNGRILADGDYLVAFGRGINFSTPSAQQLASESFVGINIDNGQFIARHRQSFDGDPRVDGVFSLTLHFQCEQMPGAGYHLSCFAVPYSVMGQDPRNQLAWNGLQDFKKVPGKMSMYRVKHGNWTLLEAVQQNKETKLRDTA